MYWQDEPHILASALFSLERYEPKASYTVLGLPLAVHLCIRPFCLTLFFVLQGLASTPRPSLTYLDFWKRRGLSSQRLSFDPSRLLAVSPLPWQLLLQKPHFQPMEAPPSSECAHTTLFLLPSVPCPEAHEELAFYSLTIT